MRFFILAIVLASWVMGACAGAMIAYEKGLKAGERQAVQDIFSKVDEPTPILTEHGAFLILPPRTAAAFGAPDVLAPDERR